MDIKVIGSGCQKCTDLYENTLGAVKDLGLACEVEKVEDLLDILRLEVKTTPSVMVDGDLVLAGRVADKEEIKEILKKYMA